MCGLVLINQDRVNRCSIQPIVKLLVPTNSKCLNKFAGSKCAAQGKC